MALWQKHIAASVILHSDSGSQYTSHEYQHFLETHGYREQYECGGRLKSFFGLLKRERVNRRKYVTHAEARADIFDYIERFYNQRKLRQLNGANIHQTTLN